MADTRMNQEESNIDQSDVDISDILPSFRIYALRLDHCYDKYESIYKHNRDLTRESKKVICTLHRLPGCPPAEQESCLQGSATQLTKLRDGIIATIASMVQGEPPHLYSPAHSGGIEEYLEALLFFSFLKGKLILSYGQVCTFMDGKTELLSFFDSSTAPPPDPQECGVDTSCGGGGGGGLVSHDAYILGLSDVSGELMRYFVKCAGIGEVAGSADVVRCLRQISSGYGRLQVVTPCLENKIGVHRRNLAKVEEINYNLNLRLSELPADPSNILLLPLEDDFVI